MDVDDVLAEILKKFESDNTGEQNNSFLVVPVGEGLSDTGAGKGGHWSKDLGTLGESAEADWRAP